VAIALVALDVDGHGSLRLTDACRPLLRGENALWLRRDPPSRTAKAAYKSKSGAIHATNSALWEALRAKRRELADAQDVPPYVIFHDATLMAMVESQPQTLAQLGKLSGIGERKLALYGEAFLSVLADCSTSAPSSEHDTVQASVALFRLGYSVEQVAEQRQCKADTIYNHLAKGIEQGWVTLDEVISLSNSQRQAIESVMMDLPAVQRNAIKPVFDYFEGQYSYGVLRCVRAQLQRTITASD
jgi:ATP-dependent DNA helicase RecQ